MFTQFWAGEFFDLIFYFQSISCHPFHFVNFLMPFEDFFFQLISDQLIGCVLSLFLFEIFEIKNCTN